MVHLNNVLATVGMCCYCNAHVEVLRPFDDTIFDSEQVRMGEYPDSRAEPESARWVIAVCKRNSSLMQVEVAGMNNCVVNSAAMKHDRVYERTFERIVGPYARSTICRQCEKTTYERPT